jgi:hypothetical protein
MLALEASSLLGFECDQTAGKRFSPPEVIEWVPLLRCMSPKLARNGH